MLNSLISKTDQFSNKSTNQQTNKSTLHNGKASKNRDKD